MRAPLRDWFFRRLVTEAMAPPLYCRFADCGYAYKRGGLIPEMCPSCERRTTWTTAPAIFERRTELKLSENDRIFLRRTKILPES